ncbi:zinc ribbon domain-containing protein [Micromonospora chersina]|uniref:zinc ribbon domain-containing protein n=1 Tax=Micromonospora chersina TaxID=47854 RepID=UPI00368960A4
MVRAHLHSEEAARAQRTRLSHDSRRAWVVSRETARSSAASLARQLAYKQQWRAGQLALVDRWYPSTKTCSACRTVAPAMPLHQRTFTCHVCGHQAPPLPVPRSLLDGCPCAPRRWRGGTSRSTRATAGGRGRTRRWVRRREASPPTRCPPHRRPPVDRRRHPCRWPPSRDRPR